MKLYWCWKVINDSTNLLNVYIILQGVWISKNPESKNIEGDGNIESKQS